MSYTCGIIGLPNAGKTTIFNALTSGQALVASPIGRAVPAELRRPQAAL